MRNGTARQGIPGTADAGARLAAIAVFDGGAQLDSLTETLQQSNLSHDDQTRMLVQAWEAAVKVALEDGLFTLDEENALARYFNHFFYLSQAPAGRPRRPQKPDQGRGPAGDRLGRGS